jgi:zinc protease
LDYKERVLANGLKVFTVEDHTTPTVSIQVWYHVGAKHDPQGRSGFAHLFEHMMFKSTRNMKSEMLDRLTEDVGGYNNAFTHDDVTVYYDIVPSNYLQTLLWAEADRMSTLNVDEGNFKSERDVVKEEYRQRILANPYGMFSILIDMRSFVEHPYKRPGIGNIEELNAASIADVLSFHSTFYRPDNATLIVSGDFNQKELDGWIDKYFGRIPKPRTPITTSTFKEPGRQSEKRFVEHAPNVPLPAMAMTYLIPPGSDAESYPLQIAETILSEGTSSRLYKSLIYEKQIAQSAEADADLRQDVGLFVFRMTMASGKKLEEGEQALLEELKKLQDKPVTTAELEKAKTKIVTGSLHERQTNNGKALALGEAAVIFGNARRVNTDIEMLQKVTAEDVQRVMKKYFSPSNRVVIHYLPEAEKPEKKG